jgi:hypothetical protein
MNVRWDAVVGQDTFWSTPPATPPSSTPAVCEPTEEGPIAVEVRLYGMLAVAQGERSLKFTLPGNATLSEVIGELQRRLDPEVLGGIVGPNGDMNRCCRIFLNGAQTEDPATPIRQAGAAAAVEIILLVAAEGG